MAAAQMVRGVPLSTLCPKFLHTNSTSHTWPFSAIAELIDNAYDPDVNAKQIWIDKTQIKDMECLTFMDNGNGLSSDMMHMMLSFGYSDKKAVDGKHPIGMYGNGFKSGSMRLGQDAIVLSKSKNDLCVGMLSQTYLKRIGAKQITVPIISIKKPEAKHFIVMEEHEASLRDILDHSPFNTEEELLTELRAIESSCSSTGTRIIIWNLRRATAGNMEFDFNTDRYDVRIPSDVLKSTTEPNQRPGRQDYSVPESEYSLREYCSVLYMKPRMQINIRGQKVRTQLISQSLAHIARDIYKPSFVKQKIPITFGYNTKSKEHYGLMMYHKNRLIKAYHRVGCQLNASNKQGIGVIGVIECNFLEPTLNQQDFDNTDKYRNTIKNVATKLEEYCKQIRFKRKNSNRSNNVPIEEEERCETMEEPEDSEQLTNPETYKIQLKRLQPTTPQNESKRQKLDDLKRKLVTDMSLSSSTTPPTPVPCKDLNIDDDPLEGSSTPAPTEPTINPVEVRLESDPMDSAYVAFTSPCNSYVNEPTVNYIIPQMRDEEEMRDKSIQIWDADEEDEEELWDEIIEISDEEEEDEEMRGKSTQMRDEDDEEMRDKSTQMQGPRVKDEEEMNSSTAANDGAKVMEEGMISIIQAQEERDQLKELLQSVSNERDSFKEKVKELQAQLELKKQCADCQTAREKAEKLSREKEDLTCRLDQSRNELEKLHLKISTKFLHTNSTSHTRPFSAIAELIDNGYEPDVNATEIWIDKTKIRDMECLTFMDNGNGFSPDLMQRKLSDKKAVYGEHPICMYGNGFKSGLMRLGQDAIVLSKSTNDLCVGMLSQIYLEIGAKHICVPIISFNKQEANKFSGMWENQASLRDILDHSPFNTEEELLTELQAIEGPTGTKIIIWNLCRTSEGNMELDFTTENDIRIICNESGTSVPEIHSSLRAYCSILYLRPSMQINIRGPKVEDRRIYESLDYIDRSYSYKPKTLEEKIPIIFGDNKSKEHYGLMMYHKNRLIKAYKRVTTQMTSIGVIGVIECNYLTPTPNKQDFDNDDAYRNTIKSMAEKLRDYSEKRSKNVGDNNSNNNSDNNNVPIEVSE